MNKNNKKIEIGVRRYLFYGVLAAQSLFGMEIGKNDLSSDVKSLPGEKFNIEYSDLENSKLSRISSMPNLCNSSLEKLEEKVAVAEVFENKMTVKQASESVFNALEKAEDLADIWSDKFFAENQSGVLCHAQGSPFLVLFKEKGFEYFREGVSIFDREKFVADLRRLVSADSSKKNVYLEMLFAYCFLVEKISYEFDLFSCFCIPFKEKEENDSDCIFNALCGDRFAVDFLSNFIVLSSILKQYVLNKLKNKKVYTILSIYFDDYFFNVFLEKDKFSVDLKKKILEDIVKLDFDFFYKSINPVTVFSLYKKDIINEKFFLEYLWRKGSCLEENKIDLICKNISLVKNLLLGDEEERNEISKNLNKKFFEVVFYLQDCKMIDKDELKILVKGMRPEVIQAYLEDYDESDDFDGVWRNKVCLIFESKTRVFCKPGEKISLDLLKKLFDSKEDKILLNLLPFLDVELEGIDFGCEKFEAPIKKVIANKFRFGSDSIEELFEVLHNEKGALAQKIFAYHCIRYLNEYAYQIKAEDGQAIFLLFFCLQQIGPEPWLFCKVNEIAFDDGFIKNDLLFAYSNIFGEEFDVPFWIICPKKSNDLIEKLFYLNYFNPLKRVLEVKAVKEVVFQKTCGNMLEYALLHENDNVSDSIYEFMITQGKLLNQKNKKRLLYMIMQRGEKDPALSMSLFAELNSDLLLKNIYNIYSVYHSMEMVKNVVEEQSQYNKLFDAVNSLLDLLKKEPIEDNYEKKIIYNILNFSIEKIALKHPKNSVMLQETLKKKQEYFSVPEKMVCADNRKLHKYYMISKVLQGEATPEEFFSDVSEDEALRQFLDYASYKETKDFSFEKKYKSLYRVLGTGVFEKIEEKEIDLVNEFVFAKMSERFLELLEHLLSGENSEDMCILFAQQFVNIFNFPLFVKLVYNMNERLKRKYFNDVIGFFKKYQNLIFEKEFLGKNDVCKFFFKNILYCLFHYNLINEENKEYLKLGSWTNLLAMEFQLEKEEFSDLLKNFIIMLRDYPLTEETDTFTMIAMMKNKCLSQCFYRDCIVDLLFIFLCNAISKEELSELLRNVRVAEEEGKNMYEKALKNVFSDKNIFLGYGDMLLEFGKLNQYRNLGASILLLSYFKENCYSCTEMVAGNIQAWLNEKIDIECAEPFEKLMLILFNDWKPDQIIWENVFQKIDWDLSKIKYFLSLFFVAIEKNIIVMDKKKNQAIISMMMTLYIQKLFSNNLVGMDQASLEQEMLDAVRIVDQIKNICKYDVYVLAELPLGGSGEELSALQKSYRRCLIPLRIVFNKFSYVTQCNYFKVVNNLSIACCPYNNKYFRIYSLRSLYNNFMSENFHNWNDEQSKFEFIMLDFFIPLVYGSPCLKEFAKKLAPDYFSFLSCERIESLEEFFIVNAENIITHSDYFDCMMKLLEENNGKEEFEKNLLKLFSCLIDSVYSHGKYFDDLKFCDGFKKVFWQECMWMPQTKFVSYELGCRGVDGLMKLFNVKEESRLEEHIQTYVNALKSLAEGKIPDNEDDVSIQALDSKQGCKDWNFKSTDILSQEVRDECLERFVRRKEEICKETSGITYECIPAKEPCFFERACPAKYCLRYSCQEQEFFLELQCDAKELSLSKVHYIQYLVSAMPDVFTYLYACNVSNEMSTYIENNSGKNYSEDMKHLLKDVGVNILKKIPLHKCLFRSRTEEKGKNNFFMNLMSTILLNEPKKEPAGLLAIKNEENEEEESNKVFISSILKIAHKSKEQIKCSHKKKIEPILPGEYE